MVASFSSSFSEKASKVDKIFILHKKNLHSLVQTILKHYRVIGPMKINGNVFFRELKEADELFLEYKGHTRLPPKRYFLPEKEVLFSYEIKGNEVIIKDHLEYLKDYKAVLIGIHPCDIQALNILDKVFISEFEDPYYTTRRKNTLIIGLTCNEPSEYCFCYFTRSGPNINDGYDLLLTDLGDMYLVEVGSSQGKSFIDQFSMFFDKADPQLLKKKEEKINSLVKQMQKLGLPFFNEIYSTMVNAFYDDFWEDLGRMCLACGKCNYSCPTCYCFDVQEESEPDLTEGRRIRRWDSCHFLSFTRVASGEIFRKDRTSRVKQRIYHKLVYSVNNIGTISCVGCGRCIETCTANIDIRDVVKNLMKR